MATEKQEASADWKEDEMKKRTEGKIRKDERKGGEK